MSGFEGRRVLVTGASSGIGAETVRVLAAGGARVAGLARRGERLEELADEVGMVPVVADLRDEASIREAVATAARDLEGLDGLVNNAGMASLSTIADGVVDEWRAMFEVNVLGLLIATQAAIPHLTAVTCADVVNVTSMAGRRLPEAGAAVYGASKAAVNMLSSGLRKELQQTPVRISLVAPGMIATEMLRPNDGKPQGEMVRLAGSQAISAEAVARAIGRIIGEPAEVNTLEMAIMPTAQELGWS